MRHLLSRADRDADAVRGDPLGYVAERLGDPTGVRAVDETGFPKKGTTPGGVARPAWRRAHQHRARRYRDRNRGA